MKAQPIRKYRSPVYPTRLEVLAMPELLRENLPLAWKTRPEMAGVIAVMLMVNACTNSKEPLKGESPKSVQVAKAPVPQESVAIKQDTVNPIKAAPATNNKDLAKAAKVAPLFVHGEGRVSGGCDAVVRPQYLAEEEALQIVKEELRIAGVAPTMSNVEMKNIAVPCYEQSDYQKQIAKRLNQKCGGTLNLDIVDAKHNVAVEYISGADCGLFGGVWDGGLISTDNYQKAAQNALDLVSRKGKGLYFGAFYDPLPPVKRRIIPDNESINIQNMSYEEREEYQKKQQALYQQQVVKTQAESKRLLRLQVRDFVDWLKGQGVI